MREENFKRFVPENVPDGQVAFGNEILRVKTGSEALGTSVGPSDIDEQGIYIEPPEYVMGFKQMEHFTWRSKPEGERSEVGDRDLTLYSLRKFVSLAINGNPSILNVLFSPPETIIYSDTFGSELLNLAPEIISKEAVPRFLGYLDSQKKRLLGQLKGHKPKRTELVEKYGYDTKYAMHALRLGYQGLELLTNKELILPMRNAEWLKKVRHGEYTLEQVVELIECYEELIYIHKDESTLRDKPDMDLINEWLINIHIRYWKSKDAV